MRRFASFMLMVLLTGCGFQPLVTVPSPVSSATPGESSAEAAMLNRLNMLLEQCLAAAKKTTSPRDAEAAARAVYERWKRSERGEAQFHVQVQPLAKGGMQIQLQVQLTEGTLSLQAQRQAILAR